MTVTLALLRRLRGRYALDPELQALVAQQLRYRRKARERFQRPDVHERMVKQRRANRARRKEGRCER